VSAVCVVCGRPACDFHHLTGRRLDFDLGQPVCHDHHEFFNDDWNTLGVPKRATPENFFDRLHFRLARLASFLGRMALSGVGGQLIEMLADCLGRWAAGLQWRIVILDERYPGWREHPEMNEPPECADPPG
jgi:hypothetical protein